MTTRELNPEKSTNVRTGSAATRRRNDPRVVLARASLRGLAWLSPELATQAAARLFVSTQRGPARPDEGAVLASATELRLRARGRDLVGWTWGGQRRDRVLLVHGWNGRATQLGAFVEPLLGAGLGVAAFDLGGHGRSSGSRATGATMAEDLLAIGELLGPLRGVVAHSFGGPVTTLAVLAGLDVERAVFVAPPMRARAWLDAFTTTLGLYDLAGDLERRLEAEVGIPFDELSGDHLGPAMRIPLLVVHDEGDRDVPWAAGAALVDAWPGARLVTTAGLGHHRILADPSVVETVTGFVTIH